MFKDVPAFSSFSVDDTAKAKAFYADVLGLEVTEEYGGLQLKLAGGGEVMIYPKAQAHQPATFTVLNFPVKDIQASVKQLTEQGVTFEQYPEYQTNEQGITPGIEDGPSMAWFKDPAGNIISVMQLP